MRHLLYVLCMFEKLEPQGWLSCEQISTVTVLLFVNSVYPPTLPTFAIELFSIVRMVTIVKTAVTASVTRAGGVSRGSTKPTHDKMTTITDGAYT